jgi:chromosomal replication initiation ATPase DnaA
MSQVFSFSHLTEVIKSLSVSVRKQDFLTYFKKFSLVSATEDSITLGVVSSFHRDNLVKKFYDEIKEAVQKINPAITSLDIVVDDEMDRK